ncbi:hypothetical protein SAMN06265222_101758 [Neorhodopirellula lusitana]|uniref:Uncharacterized protein n=1 Tax=Neorhodopirellula lusitana TaxID=445327 RepID=A0ABY1PTP9_9BACT|nr:hypothetical protein [Neorhodopirellula lusitana]SMP42310.1 hypothetical protein SAMN06265222_101758 [Neorhodopirellula lusitana]
MSANIQDLIHGYFDETLSREQFQQLNQWIKSDPLHAQQFASELMLHDRLRNEFVAKEFAASELARSELAASESVANEFDTEQLIATDSLLAEADEQASVVSLARHSGNTWGRSAIALATTACVVLISVGLFWNGFGTTSASAAVVELNRLIAANRLSLDRTFLISVEETVVSQVQSGRDSPEHRRPPKPSLDNAILEVRGSDHFVLKREVEPGVFFVTGSNGTTSWAVRPDGPVRLSNDLTRFNRDLPGHERSLPINNIEDGLDALQTAYDLELLPVEGREREGQKSEAQERDGEADAEPTRQMVAIKKPGILGPARIEINYTASSGQIRQMRFIEMPYGRNVVTLKMTLIDEPTFTASHFDHHSHHDPKRIVEFE